MMRRRGLHRAVFLAAGVYNLGWGLYSILNPQWLFRLSGMQELNHPAVFACVGMIVGLYGVLYLAVARNPEQGWLIAAVGLTGKVLGPIGWANLVCTGSWPPQTFILCLTNDVLWWGVFGLYLYDAWPSRADLQVHRGSPA